MWTNETIIKTVLVSTVSQMTDTVAEVSVYFNDDFIFQLTKCNIMYNIYQFWNINIYNPVVFVAL